MTFVPVGTMRYKARYYLPVLRSVLRRTHLKLDRNDGVIEIPFLLTDQEKGEWRELFDVGGEAIPLPYELSAMTPPVIRILTSLGANFTHLRHVRTSIRYEAPIEPGTYEVRARLDDVAALGSNSIIAVLGIDVLDSVGAVRVSHTASFMVANVGPRNIARLKAHPGLNHTDLTSLDLTRWTKDDLTRRMEENVARGLKEDVAKRMKDGPARWTKGELARPAEETPAMAATATRSFAVPPRMGVRFARVSGDFNFVHIYKLTARLLGFRRAFIQGSATAAYAVRYLSEVSPKPLRSLDITFIRPVFVGETVEFQCGAGKFWMSDPRGDIVAHGAWT